MKYPLAPQGVFRTIQGEGALLGVPMVFIRLAGCSVGCAGCDTDYSHANTRTLAEIVLEVEMLREGCEWAFVTGGEPADHDVWPLLRCLKEHGKTALVTSGRKNIWWTPILVDFLSVSPHGKPEQLVVRKGEQLNLVPGLGGTRLRDWEDFDFSGFDHKWITPFDGNPATVGECLEWVKTHPGFRLGVQAHKSWEIA